MYVYEAVKATGMPNLMGAMIPLSSVLNIPEWEARLLGVDDQLLDMIKYGFPMGYIGPISPTQYIDNHPSAIQFSQHVNDFIQKEIELGGVVGPMDKQPFRQWCHVSPLMTRPKNDPAARRVITDLTFPHDASVNAFIRKHTVMGMPNTHSLPSFDDVVRCIQEVGRTAHMFTIDVARAYKNFRTCPLDWPLLAIRWDSDYFLDLTMPFGARASSAHMQRVAEITAESILIKIKAAKNMQRFDQRATVQLFRASNPETCPVLLTHELIQHSPTVTKTQPMFTFTKTSRPIPASFIRNQWKNALARSGISTKLYTLHSLRKAAASAAYREGCNERQVQHFGKWASDAYKTYIQRDTDNTISKVLAKTLPQHK